jgi:Tol biopolymer transport system component
VKQLSTQPWRSVARAITCLAGSATLCLACAASASTSRTAPGVFVFAGDAAAPNLSELYAIAEDGSGFRKVTRNTQRRAEIDPAWSPDGGKIAFARSEACRVPLGSCFAIWTMNADGTDLRRLTSTKVRVRGRLRPLSSTAPTWSPDGSRIAYVRALEPSGGSNIWVMNVEGTKKRRLAITRLADSPAWSPDGERIAFSAGLSQDIYILDLRDGKVRRLLNTPQGEDLPDWSPDGQRIAYERQDDRGYDVFVMNADGSNRQNVSLHEATDAAPVWSPDGTEIAFGSDRDEDLDQDLAIFIVSVDAAGSPREVVAPGMDLYDFDWALPTR